MQNEKKVRLSEAQADVVRKMHEGFIFSRNTLSGKVFDNDRSHLHNAYTWNDIELLHVAGIIKVAKVVRKFIHHYTLTSLGKNIKLD